MAVKFLTGIDLYGTVDLNQFELQNAVIQNLAAAPTTPAPVAGQIYYDTVLGKLRIYTGATWLTMPDGTGANDFLTGLAFNTGNGVLTATVSNQSDVTVDLDGRYALTSSIPTVNNGTLTMTTSTGLDGGTETFSANQAGNTTFAVSLDLNELPVGGTLIATDQLIALNGTTESRQLISNIPLSIFSNDVPFLTSGDLPTVSNATITLTAGDILDGGGAFTLNQAANETITFDLATLTGTGQTYGNTSDSIKIDTIAVDVYGRVTGVSTGPTGQVNTVGTNTATTIDITGGAINPKVSTKTAAVAENGTALATGDQIYDFVTGQIANIPSGLSFEGSWNADTDTPDLSTATPDNGQFWIVSVAGTTDLDGIDEWAVGDWAIYVSTGAGTDGWQKVDNSSTLSGFGDTNQVTYWTSTGNVAGDADFTFNPTGNALAVGGTITAGGIMTAPGGNSTEWNTGYDNMITGFTDSGSGTITLTLEQQDGGTLTTSFANPQGTMSSWTIKEGNGTESTTVTNGETLTIAQGTGIESELTSTTSGGTITITNTDRGSSQNIFKNVASSSGTAVADNNNDTLTVVGAGGISTAVSGDTLTITSSNGTNSDFTKVGTIAIGALSGTVTHTFGINTMVQTIDSSGNTVYCDISRTTTSVVATISATQTTAITILVQKIG